ncbi:MAG: response regulator, partial [Deltaproteobacteria bacterium]|nr:response regulator [Deltaproteobacteria bacterium]
MPKISGMDNRVRVPKVLVVDDNVQNVELLEALLNISGYEVMKAYNGKEAIQKVAEFDPDIILLDVLMPIMDGYETCHHLKQDKKTRFIPIVL